MIYTGLGLATLLLALIVSVFLFQDKIIQQFIQEANKRLATPVDVRKIEVSIFQHFPQLSIVLHDVYVDDSHAGKYPLLTAKKISLQLNPIDAWKGIYVIQGLRVDAAEVNLKINARGENNYTVIRSESKTSGAVSFDLQDIIFNNTRVHYLDLIAGSDLVLTSDQLRAAIRSEANRYHIGASGDVVTEKISLSGQEYLSGKTFSLDSKLIYDDNTRALSIEPSTLRIRESIFTLEGKYTWKGDPYIDLKTKGEQTDIQTLLSLLPENIAKQFSQYQSKGDVYFNARLKGNIDARHNPGVSIDFGFRRLKIFHPDYKSTIEDASLEGSFATSDMTDTRYASLVLKNMTGTLNDEPFTTNLIIQNFQNPEVICDFKGRLDAAAILGFYPIENIKEVSGALLVDISFEGQIALLKKKATAQRVLTQGIIELQDINLLYGQHQTALQHLKGSLQFSNNDLALSNVSCRLGNSDFLLNGFFKNIITFLLFENQPIGIETDLKSQFLDVDELFALGFGTPSEGPKQQYAFSISRNVNLNFNCDVQSLRYKKFKGQNLQGDLLVKNEVAVSRNLSLSTMGGRINLSGIVDATNNKAIDVVSTLKLEDIHVDSIFYVFENFGQEFIQDKHLKGLARADINLEMTLNQNLKLFPETLVADIGAVIQRGELNNFEPMKKLGKYIKDEGLNRLRFSDLKNDIHIEKKTIYIPQMEIRSNVTELKISGTHTFDQQIDYRIVTPLRGRKSTDQELQGAVEDDGGGKTRLFLKITGTTDDYHIAYDTEAVKKKIINDLKKEVQELKDAFKNKGAKKKKELELQQDEYFEWDN